MKDWDQLDVSMLRVIKMNGNGFVGVILDTSSVFPKAFSQCTPGFYLPSNYEFKSSKPSWY